MYASENESVYQASQTCFGYGYASPTSYSNNMLDSFEGKDYRLRISDPPLGADIFTVIATINPEINNYKFDYKQIAAINP